MVASLYRLRHPAYVVAILTALLLIWHNGRKGDGINEQSQWIQTSYMIYVIAAVISVVSIAVNLLRARRVGVSRWLARASFFVFLSHPFVLGYVSRVLRYAFKVFNHFVPDAVYSLQLVSYLIRPFLTVAICLLVYWALGRWLPRLLSLLTGSRVTTYLH